MNNTQWNELFCAFFDAENAGIVVPFQARTTVGRVSHLDTAWEHFGCEWKNYRDYESLKITLTEDNRGFVLNTLDKLAVPYTVRGDFAIVCAHPLPDIAQ